MTIRKVPFGLYDTVVTTALKGALSEAAETVRSSLDAEEAAERLGQHLGAVVARALRSVPEKDRPERQVALVNSLVAVLHEELSAAGVDAEHILQPAEVLTAVVQPGAPPPESPLTPLGDSALLVNAHGEPRVGEELRREIPSADRIDLLCAFIKWFGLRVLEEPLAAFLASGRTLRVLTTTYMAATEPRPLEWLKEKGAQIKVSYDGDSTRLHAKAWLFHRASGFSTAYVGSSNLSHSALLDGIEWNVRLAQHGTPHLLEKFAGTFESYWNDPTFEPYDPGRLQIALRAARTPSLRLDLSPLEVHALPHQREILERLLVERDRHNRWKNLVVAATGTGKTVIAALDYARERSRLGNGRLLFVAHRRELLEQSLHTFRAVLRDGSFGELFVGGERPEQWDHVFASIQSLHAHGPTRIDPRAFDVVIVDEFHHAEAKTYTALLEHLRPKLLLGLTATPERADGKNVTDWFDGHVAAELRLWDALERALLSPFQYFGVHDDVDLSRVTWSRGGYERAALEKVYTGNDARVAKVLEQVRRRVPDVSRMRALGFCVGVEHARFMADRFRAAGIPAAAIDANTHPDERADVLRKLRERELNVVFAVDLFNEGVDVPEIDTVLFLRPTASATVFLQQLGRGLRRAPDKPCLTVLDFIGAQNRRFRFDVRYAPLLSCARGDVERHVDEGFPFLPAGCHMELDRVATRVVLDNLRVAVQRKDALVAELRERGDATLPELLARTGLELDELYRNGRTLSELRRLAGISSAPPGPNEAPLARAFERVLHVDDEVRAPFFAALLAQPAPPKLVGPRDVRLVRMLHFLLRGARSAWRALPESLADLWAHPALVEELRVLFRFLDERAVTRTQALPELGDVPLRLHGRYDRVEVLAAFDRLHVEKPYSHVAGVEHVPEHKADVFFVTLKKSEREFSPTTMYRDYAISPTLFHWESQSATREQSATGQRYIHHERLGQRIFLFVRPTKNDVFTFLGPARYVSHEGERPIAFVWRLDHAMPEHVLQQARLVA